MSRLSRRVVVAIATIATLSGVPAAPAGGSSGFGDVRSSDYYAAGVQWMVDQGLTDGTTPGCFSPQQTLTRGQLAAFVWRYEDKPASGWHPFVDVDSDAYYADAVGWMYRTGITNGVTAHRYAPNDTMTRGGLATFLWRLAGSPAAPISGFSDVSREAYYAKAVDWMVAEGITRGTTSNTFSPGRALTRGEFATFLHRFEGEPATVVDPGGVCLATGHFDPVGVVAYKNDFAAVDAMNSLEVGVHHRDPFVVSQTTWQGDHASTGGVNCSALEQTRTIHRDRPEDSIYMCHPGGDPAKGHVMTSVGDTSGYSWAWMMPKATFDDVVEVRWDVNITDLGTRQFTEVMIIPADNWTVDPSPMSSYDDGVASLPCLQEIFKFPCVDAAPRYADWDAIGASTFEQQLIIATPDGREVAAPGAPESDPARTSIRERRTHFFRDNGDGTVTFGQEQSDGSYLTVTSAGAFPAGAVRVVFKDHNYTPLKSENGFPYGHATFTWHWDDLTVSVDAN